MSAVPARWLDGPERQPSPEAAPESHVETLTRDDHVEGRRRVTRRDQLRRRRVARRRLVALALLLAVIAAGVAAYLWLAASPDPFAGVWWEPSTGRRVELVAAGDGYRLLYGAAKQPYTAVQEGDALVVAGPLGDDIRISTRDDGRLALEEGDQTSVLSRLPDGL